MKAKFLSYNAKKVSYAVNENVTVSGIESEQVHLSIFGVSIGYDKNQKRVGMTLKTKATTKINHEDKKYRSLEAEIQFNFRVIPVSDETISEKSLDKIIKSYVSDTSLLLLKDIIRKYTSIDYAAPINTDSFEYPNAFNFPETFNLLK